jgi:hypothetical protein
LPPALWPAAKILDDSKSRRHRDVKQTKRSGPKAEDEWNRRILVNIITIDVQDMRVDGFHHDGRILYGFPYDGLMIKIVWELVDNRLAAQVMGLEVIDDLVALLEAASRCEAKFHERDSKV